MKREICQIGAYRIDITNLLTETFGMNPVRDVVKIWYIPCNISAH